MAFSGVIREADTEEAANTAEARGRRSVAAARAGLPPPRINQLPVPQVSQPPATQPSSQVSQTSQASQVDVGDVFGSLVGLLRDSLIIFGVPTRGMFAARAQRKEIEQAAAVYDATVTATKQAIELFGGLDFNDPDAQAVVGKFAARFDAVVPGGGESLLGALDIFQSQGEAAIDSAGEHRDNLLALCGQTPGTMACIKKALADTAMVKQWDVVADEQRLPVIVEKFGAIEDAVKDNPVLEQLRENGWTIDDLHRLPKEFQFTPDELITIGRNEQLQNALIEIGFRPPSLIRKEAEAEITEGTKAKFRQAPAGTGLAKLQAERAKAEAAGDTRLAGELNKKIIKEITITGRTPEDVRTGLTGATPKDLDKLRAGIRDMQGNLEELEKTRKAFEANPEAGGILGTVLESAGGLLGQIPFIGEDLADLLPGDQEKVKKARTQARFTVASMLTTITKEETGRFTDTERAIAQEAVSALDVTASARQIQAALETAIDIMTDSQNRKVDELLSASGLNLPGDLEKFHKILRENLFTQDQADDAILDVMARRGIPLE